ncbi:MAG TPA: anti-sigma factor [Pyrinomonadaceae bacterium]|nr:anti-sigma factor [Pyrinomonadaceae bacterium]
MAHEYFQEMIASHSLSALDAAEERALEGHLTTCESCRGELDQWRLTAAALAFAGSVIEPSPQLRERILEKVRQERAFIQRPEPAVAPDTEAKIFPFSSSRKNIWVSVGSLGVIAASLVLVVLIVSVFVLWRENRAVRSEIMQLANQMQTTEAELARERETVALLTSSGAHLAELAGTTIAQSARATIAFDQDGRALLLAKGLPATPPGKAYQLWFIVGNQKLPGKVFTTDASGNGSLKDEIPAIARRGAVFAVTLESAQGATTPTGQIFLVSGS